MLVSNLNYANVMRYLIYLILLSLVLACSNIEPTFNNQDKDFQEIPKYQDSIQDNAFLNVKGFVIRDSFTLYRLFSGVTILTDGLQKPLHIDENYSSNQVIEDFNGDGLADIRFQYLTNVPGVETLLIYNEYKRKFMEVENFPGFPSSVRIRKSNCFFSYSRAGCADLDWISKLYVLEDFNCVEVGRIYGSGCEGNSWNGMVVHKTTQVSRILIDSFPRPPGYYQDKFEFIETYWNENASKFVN